MKQLLVIKILLPGLVVIAFLFAAVSAAAQVSLGETEEIPVRIISVDGRELPFAFRKYEKAIIRDDLEYTAGELLNGMIAAGYATASVDRYNVKGDTALIHVFIGEQYRITGLDVADTSRFILDELGLRRNWSKSTYLTGELLTGFQERILQRMENNGYPYAKVGLDNARIDSNEVRLALSLHRGPLIRFDTIHNVKQASISQAYLGTYTGIRENRIFDQSLVEEVDGRLAELPFLRVVEPTRLWFSSDNLAHVEVFLEERKVSRFDFLIGVLPNNSSTGKVLVTGEAGVSLWNIFGTGKKIDVGWKRLKPKSQQLHIYFDWPYILRTPLGADIDFNLDKQDTSYLDLDWTLGIQYLFRGNDKVKIVVHNTQTLLQTPDTTFIRQTGQLPSVLDQSTFLSGLEAYFERLDYLFNPSRGWELGATLTAGYKKIKENNTILDVTLPEDMPTTEMLYDSLSRRSGKVDVRWLASLYFPLAQRQVLKLGVSGAAVYNEDLLTNELHRIGGNDLLRGFDEESIFTSLYNIMTLEYRYLLDQNAYLSVFFDWAYTEQRLKDSFTNDFPFGFGAGLNFETKAGIFGVSYAVGRQNKNPLDFKSSKIHFGYVNIF
jgi:outer membrane protein assembly factor BamA